MLLGAETFNLLYFYEDFIMAPSISSFGLLHTIVGIIPIIAGLYAFARYYKIDISKRSGKLYLVGTVFSVLTSLGVSSTGGLNEGHIFGVIVLFVAFGGALAPKIAFLGRLRPYLSNLGLSFSFFLSLVPTTNETLSRIPISHPLAEGPQSPAVLNTLAFFFILFIVGFIFQCRQTFVQNKLNVS